MTETLSLKCIQSQKKIFLAILGFSIISFLVLSYQTYLYYVEGYCGCSSGPIFSLYSVFWGIPISLFGMIGVGVSLILSVYFLTLNDKSPLFEYNYLIVQIWFMFQIIAILFVINLMYIAYIIAKTFCELCLVSQIAAFAIFILLLTLINKFKYDIYFGYISDEA